MGQLYHKDKTSKKIQDSDSIKLLKHHLSVSKYCVFRVDTYASTVKEIYVFGIPKENIIKGLVYEKVDQSKSKPIWQIQDLQFKSLKFLHYSNSPIDISSTFIKYGWDRKIHFGWDDGEDAEMLYPVYSIAKLPISNQVHHNLITLLEGLVNKLQDWNEDSTIMEIIDPDLNPNYFIEKPPKKLKKNASYEKIMKDFYLQGLIDSNDPNLENFQKKIKPYSWFPVDILLRPDNSFHIFGEIHNLPKKENESLYENLFCAFRALLPGFRELGIFSSENEQVVQVVVKAQKIVIRNKKVFEENWHLEGRKDNVVAAGVYFCKVQPNAGIQFMAFKPKKYPNKIHKEVGAVPKINVPINEQSAIVFENSIPHKFYSLENNIGADIEVLALSFFIINPNTRHETNQLRLDVFNILKKHTKLPKCVIDEILSYVYCNNRPEIAKESREEVRKILKGRKKRWIFYEDDNSGFYHLYRSSIITDSDRLID